MSASAWGVQSAKVLLNRLVGTAPDEAALRLAQPIGVSREPVIQELKQLSELWRSARHLASAKQVGQQRRGVFRHPHLESQLARREMQRELEERAALLLGCGQFPDPPGQPGREPERQAAVTAASPADRYPILRLGVLEGWHCYLVRDDYAGWHQFDAQLGSRRGALSPAGRSGCCRLRPRGWAACWIPWTAATGCWGFDSPVTGGARLAPWRTTDLF
jgi:hypothetical protein